MRHHFADATAARDAVIAGKLENVRPPLEALARGESDPAMPDDWRPWLEEMQAAARRGSQARTLDEAAASVAVLGTTCGECHRTTHGGLHDAARSSASYDPGNRTGLDEKMARHKFSADALWIGMTLLQHQAWADGAAALMNIELPGLVNEHGTKETSERGATGEGELRGTADARLPAQDEDTPEARAGSIDLDPALRELRALGQKADQAKIASEKQDVYAQIIARCGACHAKAGAKLQ
jgi:cytochrome c553